jgi:hypothetical protein
MEIGICYLYNSLICGETLPYITTHYIIHESFTINAILTQRRITQKHKYIKYRLQPILIGCNLDNKKCYDNINIEIIKRIQITDGDGNNVQCAIYYTYLLRIIQKKWRKIIKLRKTYISSTFVSYIQQREFTSKRKISNTDSGLYGLFYNPL